MIKIIYIIMSYYIIIHGGCGSLIENKNLEKEIKKELKDIIIVGENLLKNNSNSRKVGVKCIQLLEDCEYFNAGKGAVYNKEKKHQLDCTAMDGKSNTYVGLGNIKNVKNPIILANKMFTHYPNTIIVGNNTTKLAKKFNLKIVNNSYYDSKYSKIHNEVKYSTVGIVVMDKKGNIFCANSTGGLEGKPVDRISGSAFILSDVYCNNNFGGISCSGKGEVMTKYGCGLDIINRMKYKNISMNKAMNELINELPNKTAGFIGIDKKNKTICCKYNTTNFFRSYTSSELKNIITKI
tara:strand:- start:836 stop:1717 length:882 start_codon:yes stop_codon:yes gene_type:complete